MESNMSHVEIFPKTEKEWQKIIDKQGMEPSKRMWNKKADRSMAYSLRSTSKKTDDGGDDSGPCKYDKKGRPKCEVQSEGIEEEPIEIISAQISGQTQNVQTGPKLGEGVPKNLKDLVLGLANTNKCGEVFVQLIQTSSTKYEEWKQKSQKNGTSIIETIYDSLKRVSIDRNNRTHAGNAGGDVRFKDDYNTDPRGILAVWSRFAAATMQEMIHQVFSDDELLTASVRLYNNLDSTIKPGVDAMIKANKNKLYEHHILGEACKINDSQVTTPFKIDPSSISPFSNPYWNFP